MTMDVLRTTAGWAWETSLAASPLIVLALVATLILRNAIFTPIRYMLGLLVIARLLLPSAPESPASVYNLALAATPTEVTSIAPLLNAPESPILAPAKRSSIKEGLPVVWAIGVLFVFARMAFQYFKVRRWIRNANRITSGPIYEALVAAKVISGTDREIKLFIVPQISVPALFGFLRPAILLPSAAINNGPLRMVLLHEIAHIKRWDVLVRWVMISARALHWFNPLAWVATRRLTAEQELLCDRAVMRLLGREEQRDYAEILLALASEVTSPASVIAVSGTFREMKERIVMIRQFKAATHRSLRFALPPLAVIIAMLTFTAAVQKPAIKRPSVENKKAAIDLVKLQKELEKENERVAEKDKIVDRIQNELKITDISEEEFASYRSERIRNLVRERASAEGAYAKVSQLYTSLKLKNRGDLRQAIPTAYSDDSLNRYLSDLARIEQQLTVMSKEYSEFHPEIRRLTALYSNINSQVEARIDGILSGLERLVSARRAVLEQYQKDFEKEISATPEMDKYRPYFKARKDLETEKKIRDSILVRILQEKVDQAAPKTGTVNRAADLKK
jgi:beta-lactamase regulating signal transducer with metallopeptidase domain